MGVVVVGSCNVLVLMCLAMASLLLLADDLGDAEARALHYRVAPGGGGGDGRSGMHRKLLGREAEAEADAAVVASTFLDQPSRLPGGGCTRGDIVVNQGATSPLPNGIPAYTVEIINQCPSGCAVLGIHLRCGWFSSIRLVSPRVFRRLRYDDCLVNDGKPLRTGETLSFLYANTYPYPLSVSSVSCP